MNLALWDELQYFRHYENWGNIDLMDEAFVKKLDTFREELGSPIIINCGTQGKHTINSSHYKGLAADVIILSKTKILDLLFLALRHDFSGIGYYPDWKYKGKILGGWHFDTSEERKAIWLGLGAEGQRIYASLNQDNLKSYGII